MSRILKWLAITDACMFGLFILLLFMTRNSNDFSGLIAYFPLVAVTFLTVSILVLLFVQALRNVSSGKVPNDIFKLIVSITLLVGIPWLGYHYAIIGQNRENLLVLTKIALVVGGLVSAILIVRFVRFFHSTTPKR